MRGGVRGGLVMEAKRAFAVSKLFTIISLRGSIQKGLHRFQNQCLLKLAEHTYGKRDQSWFQPWSGVENNTLQSKLALP